MSRHISRLLKITWSIQFLFVRLGFSMSIFFGVFFIGGVKAIHILVLQGFQQHFHYGVSISQSIQAILTLKSSIITFPVFLRRRRNARFTCLVRNLLLNILLVEASEGFRQEMRETKDSSYFRYQAFTQISNCLVQRKFVSHFFKSTHLDSTNKILLEMQYALL